MTLFSLAQNTKAAASVYTAIVLPLLIGALALSIDGGFVVFKRQDIQKMADIGAIAAYAAKSAKKTVEEQRLAACEVVELSGGSCEIYNVEIFSPPISGQYTSKSTYLQARVSYSASPFFASIFSKNDLTLTASAVVGGNSEPDQCCLCSLDKTDTANTLDIKGTASVDLENCGIATNSQSADALKISGNVNVRASCIYSAGPSLDSSDLPSGVTLEDCSEPTQLEDSVVDPYKQAINDVEQAIEYIVVNDICISETSDLLNVSSSESHICDPCSEFDFPCTLYKEEEPRRGTLNFASDSIELPSGLYILSNFDLVMNSSKQLLKGSDVTFILTNGSSVSITGGDLGPLTAPSTGPFQGILFGETSDNNGQHKFTGNENSNLEGAFYLPYGSLDISGSSATSQGICTQFIASSVTVSGRASLSVNNCEDSAILKPVEVITSGGLELKE